MRGSDNQGLVTIFGGSGFLGRHVVRAFARRGFRIRVAVRRPDLAGHLQTSGNVGQIHAVQANIRNSESVSRAIEGSSHVVNLTGILFGQGKQTFRSVHEDGAINIARAAAAADVETLVHVSAIGADKNAEADYAMTKGRGEEGVSREFEDAIILRPSIVFGPEDDFFNRFGAMACFSPALPLIGGGTTLFQPVYAGDVAEAVVAATCGKAEPGQTYELGGPAKLSFKELMQKTLHYTGRNCALLTLPVGIAKAQAFFLQLLPSPMLTVDQVKMLEQDNVVSREAEEEKRTLQGLDIDAPLSIETIVPQYLARFRPKGQFSVARDF